MPDNDIFTRYVSRDWRASTRCLHGDAEPKEIVSMLLSGLTRCLKHSGGLPELPILAELYEDFHLGRIEIAGVFRRAREIQSNGDHSKHVRLGVRVLTNLVAQHATRPMIVENPKVHYATAFVRDVIDNNVLDPSIPEIENLRKFVTLEERLARAAECRDAVLADGRIYKIADLLLEDPSAEKMRVPASRRPRASTVEILALAVG